MRYWIRSAGTVNIFPESNGHCLLTKKLLLIISDFFDESSSSLVSTVVYYKVEECYQSLKFFLYHPLSIKLIQTLYFFEIFNFLYFFCQPQTFSEINGPSVRHVIHCWNLVARHFAVKKHLKFPGGKLSGNRTTLLLQYLYPSTLLIFQ